jgi:hypothetical protein
VRKKPPERGYVHWDRATFDRLVSSQPEPLVSRFRVSHGMLLEVLGRASASSKRADANAKGGGGCREVARVIHRSHERRAQRRILGRDAAAMFRSLVDAGIVEVGDDKAVRVHVDLQEDFSLHHALSLWLVEALGALERESPTYALDVLTLVESILEDPEFVLRQQLEVLKRAKLAELKMAGVEYEERVAELEKLEHPKPLREFVYESFNEFARHHPWVRGDDVRPKSIAREMVERFMDFNEYVREYELGRAEGTLLRYLSDAYKTLVQTVPAPAKAPETEEIEVFLRTMVRSVDSSLLDEWERMRRPSEEAVAPEREERPGEIDITSDERSFTVLVRNAMFQLLRAIARKDWNAAAEMIAGSARPQGADPNAKSARPQGADPNAKSARPQGADPNATGPQGDADAKWTGDKLSAAFAPFFAEHGAVRLDPDARAPTRTRITKETPGRWDVVQVVCDAEGDDDWAIFGAIDIESSRKEGRPVLSVSRVSQ